MCFARFILLFIIFTISTLQAQTEVLHRAMDFLLKNQPQKAVTLLQQTLTQNPQNHDVLVLLGQAHLSLQAYDQAASAFEQALRSEPEDSISAFYLARAQIQLGNYDKAQALLRHLLQTHPGQRSAKILLAKAYFEANAFLPALQAYQALLQQFPKNAFFYRQAAVCAVKVNRPKTAETYFQKVLQLNPNDLKAAVLFYNLLKNQQRWQEALNVLNLALTNHPDNAQLYLGRGDAYLSLEKYLKARKDYSKALTLGDSSAYLYKKIGVTYYYLNDYAAALYALQKSAQKKADDPLVYYFLGLAQKSLNMPDKAIASFHTALKLSFPTFLPDLYFYLADAYTTKKNYKMALKYYKETLEVDPERKIVLFYMATIYDKYYKDLQVPLRYYQQFLQQAGDKIPARYKTYALERMKAIKEKLHFQKGKIKK